LHNEILHFNQGADETNKEMKAIKDLLIQKITAIVHKVYPEFEVKTYGSYSTGLGLHWSDIDLVVSEAKSGSNSNVQAFDNFNHMNRFPFESPLTLIQETLKSEKYENAQWLQKIMYINAKWPIINLSCSLMTLAEQEGIPIRPKYRYVYEQEFQMDISHMIDGKHPGNMQQEHTGHKVIQVVNVYLKECNILKPLMLVLKQLLKVNGLNTPRYGGLGSYGLLMMIVGYLQYRDRYDNVDQQFINFGLILWEFLLFYSQFDFRQYIIACRLPPELQEYEDRCDPNLYMNFKGIMDKKDYIQLDKYFDIRGSDHLQISDPLQRTNDVSRSSSQFHKIQEIFGVAIE